MRKFHNDMRKTTPSKVAIIYPASVPWMARCLDGIRRYARENGGWHLFSSPPSLLGVGEPALNLHALRGWKGDAIIAVSNDPDELRAARKLKIPVINLAGGGSESHGVPRVMVNHYQAGRLAADHLLARGLRHLAFIGWNDLWYSEQRRLGFSERAAESGIKIQVLLQSAIAESSLSWTQRITGLAEWLAALPRQSGVFCVHDYRAQVVIEACQEAKLRIPNDIAVIGMDNDETICEHSVPTLTSVSRNSEQVGWEAAALLDRMMHGEAPPMEDLLLAPDGVIERQSTNMLYCHDPAVQRALDYMRTHLETQFNIEILAQHAAVSKRTLETRFRASLGGTPHAHLTWLRVQRAQALMQMPGKRTLEQIASECGFGTAPTFYASFQRITGESPGEFRRKHASTPTVSPAIEYPIHPSSESAANGAAPGT